MKLNKKHNVYIRHPSKNWPQSVLSGKYDVVLFYPHIIIKINTYLALGFLYDLTLHCRAHLIYSKTKYIEVMYTEYFLQYSSRKIDWIQTAADKTDLPSYKLCIGYRYLNRSNYYRRWKLRMQWHTSNFQKIVYVYA